MTGMLASVNSLEEALLINPLDIDIIDLKQPAEGALGALPPEQVHQIVTAIDGCKPVSATVGDLPMLPEILCPAVTSMAATGVDYVKIGFFPGDKWTDSIDALSDFTADHALIAVLFADNAPDLSYLPTLRQAGFSGVMLDTMDKSRGSLSEIMTMADLAQFVNQAKQLDLLCGLAGSLQSGDVPALLALNADYLGFRGGLCEQHNRVAHLSMQKIFELIEIFNNYEAEAVA
ncbi:(5-formylfuran-3-yl)methyl phosphate synthase [Methylomarinum vadi]|uniref:(5-formylfuran-3-yl)methyl phosphate synthase n=1 Tax=Methylomarinum vadi TaxID=438855 RepID=UPI000568484E|nr:(5-formylfuran-3-yl)methyl phosphate synthase [Methylomarinum vadi]